MTAATRQGIRVVEEGGRRPGPVRPADAEALLTGFANSLTKAAEGNDGEVATAVKADADLARTAADATDPVEAGKDLNAACKAAGVTTTF